MVVDMMIGLNRSILIIGIIRKTAQMLAKVTGTVSGTFVSPLSWYPPIQGTHIFPTVVGTMGGSSSWKGMVQGMCRVGASSLGKEREGKKERQLGIGWIFLVVKMQRNGKGEMHPRRPREKRRTRRNRIRCQVPYLTSSV